MIAWLRASSKWVQIVIVLLAAWLPYALVVSNHPIVGTFVFIGLTGLFLIAQPLRLRDPAAPARDDNEPTPPAQ